MITFTLGNLMVKVKYVTTDKNGNYVYQRAVPENLQGKLKLKKIQIPLKGTEISIVREANRLAKEHDTLFDALSGLDGDTPSKRQELAKATLAYYGAYPGAANFYVIDENGNKQQPQLADIEWYMEMRKANGVFNSTDEVANTMLTNPPALLLSQAAEIYFKHHESGSDLKHQIETNKRWLKLVKFIKQDKPIASLTRDDFNNFIRSRLDDGVKTSTVDRELKTIRAVIRMVNIEKGLNLDTNRFANLKIPNKGDDATPRLPFTIEEHKQVISFCKSHLEDDIKGLILLMALTCTRPGEIAGLRREEVHLDEPIPYLEIKPNQHRRLKTKSSTRIAPLVPLAVDTLKSILLRHQDEVVFPRYMNKSSHLNTNAASQTCNKIIRTLGIDKTLYSFRHSFRDLIRNTHPSEELAQQLGGWTKVSYGSNNYGVGHWLENTYPAVINALKLVIK